MKMDGRDLNWKTFFFLSSFAFFRVFERFVEIAFLLRDAGGAESPLQSLRNVGVRSMIVAMECATATLLESRKESMNHNANTLNGRFISLGKLFHDQSLAGYLSGRCIPSRGRESGANPVHRSSGRECKCGIRCLPSVGFLIGWAYRNRCLPSGHRAHLWNTPASRLINALHSLRQTTKTTATEKRFVSVRLYQFPYLAGHVFGLSRLAAYPAELSASTKHVTPSHTPFLGCVCVLIR